MTRPSTAPLSVICTPLPDLGAAQALARAMVTKQLAACANICPGMTAIYEWNGALEETGEISMILKTRLELAAALALAAAEAYPYETPAILALLDCKANDDYGRWVSEQAMGNSEQ